MSFLPKMYNVRQLEKTSEKPKLRDLTKKRINILQKRQDHKSQEKAEALSQIQGTEEK